MRPAKDELVDLENRFWRSMVEQDTDTALSLLTEPALMVSAHGAMQFDHAAYRRMAEQGRRVLTDYRLDDVNVLFPTDDTAILTYRVRQSTALRGQADGAESETMADSSVWVRKDGRWRCAMHTETPVADAGAKTH